MSKRVFVYDQKQQAVPRVGDYIIRWCLEHEGCGIGGATGNSPIDVWCYIWDSLKHLPHQNRESLLRNNVVFLDEYLGSFPSYHHWAWRNLRIGRDGFSPDRVFVPRGAFFHKNSIVGSDQLDDILEHCPEDWQALTIPGEDGTPPEIRISDKAEHPVLQEIRDSVMQYDALVREHPHRLQLLGIGVGGAIERDREAGGHFGFVENGAAAPDTKVMLVRLAKSTIEANKEDFLLKNDAPLEPSRHAITQGISTILSAGELCVMAWGKSKTSAVHRMFLGKPNSKNPAAHVQSHDCVTVFLDRAAFGDLEADALADNGWLVETAAAGALVG